MSRQDPTSPPSIPSPQTFRSRRDSCASTSTSSRVDKEQLAQTLDKIHTSASQIDALTTFNDFAAPPTATPLAESKGIAGDLVQNGLSGLYSRLREAVGAGKSAAHEVEDAESTDGASLNTGMKSSMASLPRTESNSAWSISNTGHTAHASTSAAPTSGITTGDTDPYKPHSSKASSTTTVSAPRSTAASRQNLLNMSKAIALTAVDTGVALAPVAGGAYKEREPARSNSSLRDDNSSRGPDSGAFDDKPHQLASASSSLYGREDARSGSFIEKGSVGRGRKDDVASLDGSADMPLKPAKPSSASTSSLQAMEHRNAPTSGLLRSTGDPRKPLVIDRISGSGSRSRSSSMDTRTAQASPLGTSTHASLYHEPFDQNSHPDKLPPGDLFRVSRTGTHEGGSGAVNNRLEQMRKQVLSKEFWMADETCSECFLCGTPFSAFRRKHHCRTCGCIFDAKCTTTITGSRIGVAGTLRVCKTCLEVINRRTNDSGTDDSGDESFLPTLFRSKPVGSNLRTRVDDDRSFVERAEEAENGKTATTPMMAIPATRRLGDRTSQVLEIDAPQLSRPGSSRSLHSLASGRPQSSGHRRHNSKHNLLNRLKPTPVERVPFRKPTGGDAGKRSKPLPAFHDDNIIDPDLADYMSDESSGDEQMSIFATMTSSDITPSSLDPDKQNIGSFLSSGRKHRLRGDKSVSGLSFTSRGPEEGLGSANLMGHPRARKVRNMSNASASIHHLRSPRPKSGLMKGPSMSNEVLGVFDDKASSTETTKLTRSDSMRGDKELEDALSPPCLTHVKRLLYQLLQDADVPNVAAWEKALLPILVRCAEDVNPGVRQCADDMDIRHYVKLKKIPGGKPGDSSYVSGVMFTKNLAQKSMPRRIHKPRIVIVTFAIEYQRQYQQFMSLNQLMEQEKEYLRKVVDRIINLRPDVLIAERGIAGLALQYLAESKIAVVYNVKPNVIEALARCTRSQIISSLDMLALPVDTGDEIGGFEVKTYVSSDLPGKKKTYIVVSGCEAALGCTIALRGAPREVLARMKRITEFMIYVVYNSKLEACLMRDEGVALPDEVDDLSLIRASQATDGSLRSRNASVDNSIHGTTVGAEEQETTLEDRSATESKTPPALAESDPQVDGTERPEQTNKLISLHKQHAHASQDTQVPEDVPMPTFYSDMVAKYQTKILSASPFVKFTQPYLLMRSREQERRLVHLKRLRDQDIVEDPKENEKTKPKRFELIKPEMVHELGRKAPRKIMEVLHAVHDAEYDKAFHNYQTQTRQWENYIQGNLDLFDPYSHQNIVVLYSVICTQTKIPCVEPGLIAIAFYDEHPDVNGNMDPDCTLGQYVEDLCESADATCHSNGCDKQMWQHHRTYVHEDARVTVFVEKLSPESPLMADQPDEVADQIQMWSYCKICKVTSDPIPMSASTWNYSFGKYLELSFWSTRLVPVGDCLHDHCKDHVRYLRYHDAAIRVHYDPIDLLEIVVPRARITWKVEKDLQLKNEIFTRSEERLNRFMNSVKSRLKSIRIDSVLPDKADKCRLEVEKLARKAQDDQISMLRGLQDAYMDSKYYEVTPFNAVTRRMLEKVAEWDASFVKFEADYLSDKDVRQLTILQLKKIFTDDESKESLPSPTTTSTEATTIGSETDERSTPHITQNTAVTESDEKGVSETTHSKQPENDIVSGEMPVENDKTPTSGNVPDQADAILDRVQPLDLATPHSPSMARNPLSPPQGSAEASQAPSVENTEVLPSPITALPPISRLANDPSAPSLTLTEKVEQLRRENRAVSHDVNRHTPQCDTTPEKMRPVPDRLSSRRAGTAVSPPMLRTLSQPVSSLPRRESGFGKGLHGMQKGDPAAAAGAELSRVGTDSSVKSEKKLSERLGLGVLKNRKGTPSSIPRLVHNKRKESKVSTLARHFEQLSREFEKERIRDRNKRQAKLGKQPRAGLPRASTKAIVEVYEDVDQAVLEPNPYIDDHTAERDAAKSSTTPPTETPAESPTAEKHPEPGIPTVPEQPSQSQDTATEGDTDHMLSQGGSEDEGGGSDGEGSLLDDILPDVKEIAEQMGPSEEIPLELPKHQKSSLMKMLTNFWAERSSAGWSPLEYPMSATDHIFIDSDVIVREDEPSSLIAFALSSQDYKAKVSDIRRSWQMTNQRVQEDGRAAAATAGGIDDTEARSLTMSESVDMGIDEDELEKSLLRSTGTHLKYQFTEGSAKMLCKIFYAEQFDALRRKCGVADRIIESLSRCLKWDSKGGKTKSVFLKTLDDRLVMKSLSPVETSAFLRFAPAYFEIMAEALFHELPSVIAKMVGFFQIIVKNPVTNTEIKLDLLVMENLFYDRSPTRIFDLKGSMRNRKIQSTGEQNEVLLDENMVEYIYESPLFTREHSKKLLRASVWNDTLFLARQNVMDYSLMVAVDEARKELVVGIIDCIRTFTWDKKLESWIKDKGLVGGGRNRPTVTSPKEYKSRFREAMARYILQAPNCWHQFGSSSHIMPMTPRTRFEDDVRGP